MNHYVLILRYLIDLRWLKQWKKYVGYETKNPFLVGEELNDPGPIDNSSLFASKTLHYLHYLPALFYQSQALCFDTYFSCSVE